MRREPEVETAEAAKSIVDDFLIDGHIYPEGRQLEGSKLRTYPRDAVTMGDYLVTVLDEDDLACVLTAVASGNRDNIDTLEFSYRERSHEGMAAWLIEKFPQHVELRMEQLREIARERAEGAQC